MAGPQGLTPFQPYPGTDAWAENLRAGQSAAANQSPQYQLDPSLIAARDAARLGIANANGAGQTIGATAAGFGKIVGAAGNLASDYGSAVMGAIKGFGSDIATGYNGAPTPAAQTGGASGDWANATPPAVPNNATAKATAPAPNQWQPIPNTPMPVSAAPRTARASVSQGGNGAQSSAPDQSPAGAGEQFTPVQVIRGSRVGYEYTLEDQEKMRNAGITPGSGSGGGAGSGKFGLTNPAGTIQTAFDRQQATNMAMLDRAIEYAQGGSNIFEQATRNKLVAPLISAIINGNNQGQVQGQGVNSMNQVAGGIQSAGIGAGASMYGADQGLAGHLASTAERLYEAQTSSIPTGTAIGTDANGISMPLTTYGQRPVTAGAMPTPYQQGKAQFTPGMEYTNRGKRAVYQADGTWKEVK